MKFTVLAMFHPAAALHVPRLWSTLLDDWAHLPEKVPSDFIIYNNPNLNLQGMPLASMDTETDGKGGLGQWSVAYRDGEGRLTVAPFYGKQSIEFGNCPVCFHNFKYDARELKANGMPVPEKFHDTMIMGYCLGLGRQAPKDNSKTKSGSDMVGGLGLKYLARRHLGMAMRTWEEVKDHPELQAEYNANDSVATYLLAEKWLPVLPKHYFDIDMPLLPVLMAIEDRGVQIDPDFLVELGKELDSRLVNFDEQAQHLAFHTQDMQSYIYGTLGFEPWKFTDSGMPSVDEEVLEAVNDPIVKQTLEYKRLYKEKGTYVENYINAVDSDDRIHPELKQTSTSTGRLSCVPLDSEILTKTGWKTHNSLKIGEEVLGYDIPTRQLRWTVVSAIIHQRELVGTIYMRGHSIRCTPTHNWVGTTHGVHGLYEAQQIRKRNRYQIDTLLCSRGGHGDAPVSPTEAGIVGWAITDGHIIKLAHGYSCEIQVVKDSSVLALDCLLEKTQHSRGRYGYKVGEKNIQQTPWKNRFYIGRDIFTPMWKKAKDNLTKYALSLTKEAQEAMFAAMMEADGSPRKRTPSFGANESNTIDCFSALCATLGKFVCLTPRREGGSFVDVSFSANQHVKHCWFEPSPLEEDVWCPSTGTGTWVMRQNGRVVITGNCARPNLQNVFKRDERVKLRAMFVAPAGKKIVRADYNQLDFRTLAAITQDPTIIAALNAGKKIHQVTADEMGISYDEAKITNFATMFGQEAWALSQQLSITIGEAKTFLERYFERFPNLGKYRKQMTEIALSEKQVVIPFTNRTRRIDAMYAEDWRVRQEGIKEAINLPVQGLEAEVVKICMIDLYKHNAPMILQVHDELLFEVDEKDAKEYALWLKEYIPTIILFGGMTFPVEVGVGQSWFEAMNNTI